MRIALLGAVESTAAALETLVAVGLPPVALFTLPLAKASRHSDFVDLRPLAAKLGVPVIECPDSRDVAFAAIVRDLALDELFVIGWSQILGDDLLKATRRGCVGYHPAALPMHRGRAVIPWTILLGLKTIGSTLFRIDAGVDSGPILAQDVFAVAADETARTLMDKHLASLRGLLKQLAPQLPTNPAGRIQNHEEASYCAKRTPEDGLIDWRRSARDVWTLVRAVGRPYPGAFGYYRDEKITIWSADLVENAPYFGAAGQIQRVSPEGVLVTAGDGRHVLLKEYSPSAISFKIHDRWGSEPARGLQL